MKIYDKLIKPQKVKLNNGKIIDIKPSKTPIILIILIISMIISIKVTGFDLLILIERGNEFFVILRDMVPPNIEYMPSVWKPLFDTIKMSVLGSFIGAVTVIPFAIIASNNIVKNKIVLSIARLFLSIIRTLPTLVIALIATYMFGLGTMAGTIAIGLFTFAYVGKQLYELIETVDMGSYKAAEAIGASKSSAFVTSIIPQVLPSFLSVSLFCFEGNVRYASILGYVGAGGLGVILNEKIGWREYSSVGMILVALFVTVVIIEWISHYLRVKLT